MSAPQGGMLGNLLNFLNSPQGSGLTQGLLAASNPSMTQPTMSLGGALGQGLQLGSKYQDLDRKRKLGENSLQEQIRHNKSAENLQGMTHKLAMQRYQQEQQREQRLRDLISGLGGSPAAPTASPVNYSAPEFLRAPVDETLNTTGNKIVHNPDGSISTENSITITDPNINNGLPTNIPSLVQGRQLNEQEAIEAAKKSGNQYPSFNSIESAVNAAKSRSAQLGQDYRSQQGGLLGNITPEKLQFAKILSEAGYGQEALKMLAPQDEQNLTGIPQEYNSLANLEKKYGKNSQVYKDALEDLKTRREVQRSLIGNRDTLNDTARQRAATQQGKLLLEEEDVRAGYLPNTGRTVPITPEQQAEMIGQYESNRLKNTTDTDTRQRALLATNIDKTIDLIDVDALTQYGGLMGGINKKIEQSKALTSNESEAYRKFTSTLVKAEILAEQIRSFYKGSIAPEMVKRIENLTNPASWINNPSVAKSNFESLKELLKTETKTYYDALKGVTPYRENEQKKSKRDASEYSIEELEAIASGGE
jgi:hypothetical protein